MDEQDLPTGRLGRFARLATTSLKVGAGMLLDSDARATAVQTAQVLGTMRGLAAKVGQMASYVDGVIPEGQREHYEFAMKGLRAAAPRSSPAEVRALLTAELDYRHEADNQRLFAEQFAGDAQIRVPAVIDERSSGRVLTMEFLEGRSFDEAVAAPRAEREAWARTLWRFVFTGILAGGRFNADPHPGNFLFRDGGGLGVLDFGCVQRIPDANRTAARAMHRAAIARDEVAFRAALGRMLGARPGRMEALCAEYIRVAFSPLFDSPWNMSRPFAAGLVDGMKRVAKESRAIPDAEFFAMPAEMTFMNRLQFGFYSLLARLDVTVDYAAVEREILASLPE